MSEFLRRRLINCIAVISLFVSSTTHAENSCAVFGNLEIVCLSKAASSFSPRERTHAVEKHLKALSADPKFSVKNIHVVKELGATTIVGDNVVVVSLTDADAAAYEMSREQFAFETAMKIRASIKADRRNRAPQALWSAIMWSAIATLGYVLFLICARYFFRTMEGRLGKSDEKGVTPITIFHHKIATRELTKFLSWLLRTMRIFSHLIVFYLYISLVFSFFSQTATFINTLTGHALRPLREIAAMTIAFIPNLFSITAIFLVTKYSLRLIQFLFDEIHVGKLRIDGFHHEWAPPTFKLIRFVVWAFAFAMAFPYIPGSSSPAFQGVSVVLGLLISVGSSSAIANIVAGMVISYMRPFNLGDSVKIGDTVGDVVEKNLFVTRVRTMKEVEITIPNAVVLKSHLVNYSVSASTTGLVLNPAVAVAHDVPWQAVYDILQTAALKTKQIEASPSPFVLQLGLKDNCISYELNAYTRNPRDMVFIYSALYENIQDGFRSAGVTITLPHFLQVKVDKRDEHMFASSQLSSRH